MAAAIVQDSPFGSKRNAWSFLVWIFFPIVRIFEHVRTRLILGEVAGWRSGRSSGARRSRRRLFHHRQGQHFALDSFEFSGVSLEVWLNAAKFFDFLIHALDAMLRTRMVGKKFRRILTLRLRFELLEELRHGSRVVPRIVQDLSAHDVGLRFGRS